MIVSAMLRYWSNNYDLTNSTPCVIAKLDLTLFLYVGHCVSTTDLKLQ